MAYGEDRLRPEQYDLREAAHADGAHITRAESAGRTSLRQGICYAARLKSRGLIWQYIALAADLDGTFAIARMQPCFQAAVKIATVAAARPRGGSHAGRLASTAAWAGLV